MNSEAILARVKESIDVLIAAGDAHRGLFPSMLDRRSGEMLMEAPPHIEGQRDGDRAYQGSNLMHDESTLFTMYAMGGRYSVAADRYLQRFATHCCDTESGLFPWGEHSYWHLVRDCVGHCYSPEETGQCKAIHDHLRQAPLWMWEKLYGFNPQCLERFAEGLNNHWVEGEPREYCRHAPIEKREHYPRNTRSCDFPRHSGFYILDLAFAHSKTGRSDFSEHIELLLQYWWEKRDDKGMLLIESRTPEEDDRFHNVNAPPQTLSLATSLLEAAPLLIDANPDLARKLEAYANAYIDGFFAAPHDLATNTFVILCARTTGEIKRTMPVWGSVYGVWPASYVGLLCLCTYRIKKDPRLLEWAATVGRAYASETCPSDIQAPAMDAGMGLGLLADLYDVTEDAKWLDSATALANTLADIYFDDAPLLRSAAHIDWYESQMGPGFLLHSMVRTAMLAENKEGCPLGADYTGR